MSINGTIERWTQGWRFPLVALSGIAAVLAAGWTANEYFHELADSPARVRIAEAEIVALRESQSQAIGRLIVVVDSLGSEAARLRWEVYRVQVVVCWGFEQQALQSPPECPPDIPRMRRR